MELKEKLKHIFENDYPGSEIFLEKVIKTIISDDIDMVNAEILDDDPTYRNRAKLANIKSIRYVADVIDLESEKISYFDVTLFDNSSITRSRVAIQHLLRSVVESHSHLLITFHYEDPANRPWRFSYAYKENTIAGMATAKRFTYIFGKDYRSRTAIERFVVLANSNKTDEDFSIAFSVEKLSREFFDGYKQRYQKFCNYLLTETSMIESFRYFNLDGSGKFIRDYVKKMFGRIVFLYFIQRKGWLNKNRNYMMDLFQEAPDDIKDDYLDSVLEPLFFGVLNTKKSQRQALFDANHWDMSLITGCDNIEYLNGGLFEEEDVDEAKSVFPREYFSDLFEFLNQYNFTIDENDTDDAEVGIDPEMLGRVFENLLEDNKDKGAYYTPKPIVDYMCRESIIAYLQAGYQQDGKDLIRKFVETQNPDLLTEDQKRKLTNKLVRVRICDPAIGSGAFPMGLVNILSKLFTVLRFGENLDRTKMKRYIMQNNIYGVDIEKGAVDIARLRFWLAMVVDEPTATPLPNLQFKIMQGNSLLEKYKGFDLSQLMGKIYKANEQRSTDDIYFEGMRNLLSNSIAQFYLNDNHERRANLLNTINSAVVTQLCQVLSEDKMKDIGKVYENSEFFLWHTWFADVFKEGGFDIVIGNPPYIQLQKATGRKAIDKRGHEYDEKLGDLYADCGFKSFEKTGDIYCLFYEKGMSLLKPQGILCYITSNKWMRAGYGESIRGFFAKKTNPIKLIDLSGVKIFNSATVDVNILFLKNEANAKATLACKIDSVESVNNLSNFVQQQANKCNFTTSESWVILSPIEQSIKHKIESVGTPLKDWDIQINYGIKTGFNDAFIIPTATRDQILNNCQTEDERKRTDELIRPILRGRDIKRYGYKWADLYLIATFPSRHYDIEDYPAVKSYLLSFGIERLEQTGVERVINGVKVKARKKTNNKWFEVQDSISYWEDFSKPKIVWGNLNLHASYALVDNNSFINAPSPMIVPANKYLLAMLNSKLIDYYIRQLGVTRNGGYFEYKPMFVAKAPIPLLAENNRQRILIEHFVDAQDYASINRVIYEIFGLTQQESNFVNSLEL